VPKEVFSFPEFEQRLKAALGKFNAPNLSKVWSQEMYSHLWEDFDEVRPLKTVAVADGTSMNVPFRTATVDVAWALAHIYDITAKKLKGRVSGIDIEAGYRRTAYQTSALMHTLEFKVLRQALEDGVELGIRDGSLHFVLTSRRMEKTNDDVISWLKALNDLTDRPAVGVSKGSDVTYVRTHRIAEKLRDFNYFAPFYRQNDRLAAWLRQRPSNTTAIFEAELEYGYSDEVLFDKSERPGFSKPLALAPSILTTAPDFGASTWWITSARKWYLPEVLAALDSHYSLPPTVITYWKPRGWDATFRVDVPGSMLGMTMKAGDMKEDAWVEDDGAIAKLRFILARLNGLPMTPTGLQFINEVDQVVHTQSGANSLPYRIFIREELRKRGFDVSATRSGLRNFAIRGYER
jgi:hypothetical protein